MNNLIGGTTNNSFMPPLCYKHNCPMILYFYPRPLSADGNGWSCPECVKDREAEAKGDISRMPTRFPEGSEL